MREAQQHGRGHGEQRDRSAPVAFFTRRSERRAVNAARAERQSLHGEKGHYGRGAQLVPGRQKDECTGGACRCGDGRGEPRTLYDAQTGAHAHDAQHDERRGDVNAAEQAVVDEHRAADHAADGGKSGAVRHHGARHCESERRIAVENVRLHEQRTQHEPPRPDEQTMQMFLVPQADRDARRPSEQPRRTPHFLLVHFAKPPSLPIQYTADFLQELAENTGGNKGNTGFEVRKTAMQETGHFLRRRLFRGARRAGARGSR